MMELFEKPLKFLKLSGLWSDRKIGVYRVVFCILMHFLCLECFVVFEVISLVKSKSLEEFCENFAMLPTFLGASLKSLNFIRMKLKIKKFLTNLEELIRFEDWIALQNGTKLEQRISQMKKFFVVNFVLAFAALFFGSLVPFFIHEPPFKMWFPFDYKHSQLLRWITIAYQLGTCIIYMPKLYILDNFPLFVMSYVIGLVEELNMKIEAILAVRQESRETFSSDKNKFL